MFSLDRLPSVNTPLNKAMLKRKKGNAKDRCNFVFIALITSVLIFYFNDFSAALGKTEKLQIEVSVWMPIVIIFIFGAAGLIHANQK